MINDLYLLVFHWPWNRDPQTFIVVREEQRSNIFYNDCVDCYAIGNAEDSERLGRDYPELAESLVPIIRAIIEEEENGDAKT